MCKTYHHLSPKHSDFCASFLKTLFCVPVIAITLVMTLCKWHPGVLKAWQLSENIAFSRGMSVKFPSCTLLFHLRYMHTNSGDWKNRVFLLGAPEEFHSRVPAEISKQVPYLPLSGGHLLHLFIVACIWLGQMQGPGYQSEPHMQQLPAGVLKPGELFPIHW